MRKSFVISAARRAARLLRSVNALAAVTLRGCVVSRARGARSYPASNDPRVIVNWQRPTLRSLDGTIKIG